MRLCECGDVEHVIAPCGHVQIQPACVEILPIAIETNRTRRAHQIREAHRPPTEIVKR